MTEKLAAAFCIVLFGLLAWALLGIPLTPTGLTSAALGSLDHSGVLNPVTAALLNYRGYDTLLEVSVFLLAIIGVWSVRTSDFSQDYRPVPLALVSILRLVVPLLIITGAYLLWIGAAKPGGAFQGGAVIGGGAVIVLLGGALRRGVRRNTLLRLGLAAGSLVFILVTALITSLTGGLLQYPDGQAALWMLIIESAALISIALTLGALYFGGRPFDGGSSAID